MRLFVKSILSAQFFFIYAAFLDKNRGHRRVFCHSKQLVFRPFAHRPLAQKVAQPLPRRPAKLAQICRRHPLSSPPRLPSSLPIVFIFSATPSVSSAIQPLLSATAPILPATAPILPATNYMLISGHEIMIAKHDFLISCPETTVSRLAIILKRAAGAMALVSAQVLAYAGVVVIIIIII